MRKMQKLLLLPVAFMMLCLFTPAWAEKPAWKVIQPEALHQMLEQNSEFTLINTMSSIECKDHSIPKSLCLPCETLEKQIGKLPNDKRRKLVFYCESELCLRSYKAAEKALKHGYTDVSILKDGLPGWKKAGFGVVSQERIPRRAIPSIKAPVLKTWMEEKNSIVIVDIRSEEAFMQNHIDGAINIPFHLLDVRYDDLPLDSKILVVDERGFRSFLAASYLLRKGYDVTRLFGGMEQWQKVDANAKRQTIKK
jgi:rhodanese-related sulfurtransferase